MLRIEERFDASVKWNKDSMLFARSTAMFLGSSTWSGPVHLLNTSSRTRSLLASADFISLLAPANFSIFVSVLAPADLLSLFALAALTTGSSTTKSVLWLHARLLCARKIAEEHR